MRRGRNACELQQGIEVRKQIVIKGGFSTASFVTKERSQEGISLLMMVYWTCLETL